MYYTYILKSFEDIVYYYVHIADIENRLIEHNRGKVKSIKGRGPFVLHYFETFETKSEAARRELFFKSIDGYLFLKTKGLI